MTTSSVTTSSATEFTLEQALIRIQALESAIAELKSGSGNKKEQKEMTDDHARAILIGEQSKLNHNKAAEALGLSYGQVYSCRLEYTFRHIHKELKARPEGFTNPWKK